MALVLIPAAVMAQPMTTPNFRLDPNVANSFGGLTESSSYTLIDSGGEAAVGLGSSGSYKLSSGYVSQLQQSIQLDVIEDGLVGYWPLNTGLGIQAYDVTTNNNQGVLTTGLTWVSGKISGAIDFDGEDDFITVPHAPAISPTDTLTLSGWFYQSGDAANKTLAAKWEFDSGQHGPWALQTSNTESDRLRVFTPASTGEDGVTYASTPVGSWTSGEWHHVVMAYDGGAANNEGRLKLYIDGEAQNLSFNGFIPPNLTATSHPLRIGAFGGLGRHWNGRIDEVKLYDRTLTADEVADAYAAGEAGVAGSVTFPKIGPGASESAALDAIIQTDAGGYELFIEQDKDLSLADDSASIPPLGSTIASPAAWTEGSTTGFGFTVMGGVGVDGKWGTDPNFNYAAVPNSLTSYHSRTGLNGGIKETTNLGLRLGVGDTQTSGVYKNRLGFTATLKP